MFIMNNQLSSSEGLTLMVRQYINMSLTSDSVTRNLLMQILYHSCLGCTYVRLSFAKSLYFDNKI